ncbi:protein FMP32, mitochondrial isoform X2 [Vigna angularis]|uniref:protein FMP32, mitochondrial isoform X2 n=1 Tax=Phaseolus angularis TaxID=3914 RepID=UPI0022B2C8BB|nr:protein FMP32, mitochondrial isoform X2 [Vigna angularis]
MALCKRAFHLCSNRRLCLAKFTDLDYVLPSMTLQSSRHLSQALNSNLKRAFLVDTLALSEVIQESSLSKFKSEVQSSQEHHFSLLQRETEKLRGDIEKMRSEMRYEIDKVTAGQRLDLNLERGRIRDELANQNAETSSLTNKLDREIHELRAHVEAAKYDVIKYCIGTLVSISAVGLAVIRIIL